MDYKGSVIKRIALFLMVVGLRSRQWLARALSARPATLDHPGLPTYARAAPRRPRRRIWRPSREQ